MNQDIIVGSVLVFIFILITITCFVAMYKQSREWNKHGGDKVVGEITSIKIPYKMFLTIHELNNYWKENKKDNYELHCLFCQLNGLLNEFHCSGSENSNTEIKYYDKH